MKLVVLAGGVGGARLASGFYLTQPPADLSIVVNTGDDFEHLGLHISPDLDTVTYTLAGLANRETGWGVAGDTFEALGVLSVWGGLAGSGSATAISPHIYGGLRSWPKALVSRRRQPVSAKRWGSLPGCCR